VAMSFDAAVDDVILHRGDPGDGSGDLDPFVEGRDPEGIGTAAGATRDPEFFLVDLGPGFEIIECSDRVPRLDPRRSVTTRIPPPAPEVVGPVVNPLDFAELESVDRGAGLAVFRE